jgi:hypothetical protein
LGWLCSIALAPPRASTPPSPSLRTNQAARDIAGTIASSANRVFLNAESLMLNIADIQTNITKKP